MNNLIKIKDKEFTPYKTMEEVNSAIDALAVKINEFYSDTEQPVVLLVTLSGAMMFAAELSKRMDRMVEWAFVKCSSYGAEMTSSGKIDFQLKPTFHVKGRDVLVVEDIVDTGTTWEFLYNYLNTKDVKSVRMATLTMKRDVYSKDLPVDFVAMDVENKFVVGCGLDYDGLGRNLNGIYQVASR